MSDTKVTMPAYVPPPPRRLLEPHRIFLIAVFGVIVFCAIYFMRWDWLPKYQTRLLYGIGETLFLLFSTAAVGFLLAFQSALSRLRAPGRLQRLPAGSAH
jgi:polar amino acid transport system permease protein